MAYTDDSEAIRRGLKASMPALAALLAPGGYVERGEYWPCNPARADRSPGSFVIQLHGDNAGTFHDFAAPEMSGDAIDLIAMCAFGMLPPDGRRDRDVWAYARRFLALPEQERAAPREWADKPADTSDPRPDEAKEEGAMRWWLGAKPIAPGSLGWRYLTEARRLPLHLLPRHPGAIRELASITYNKDDGAKGTKWPGLLTCMTDKVGQIKSVHRTYLAADGGGKAPVTDAKQVWPRSKGLSMRLTRGKSGLSPEEAARRGLCDDRLVLIEGIEKGLAWGLLFPDDRVTAVSFSVMKSAPLFDCAKEILIVADNDHTYENGGVDRLALDIERRAGGRKVMIARPLNVKDVDELL